MMRWKRKYLSHKLMSYISISKYQLIVMICQNSFYVSVLQSCTSQNWLKSNKPLDFLYILMNLELRSVCILKQQVSLDTISK